MTIDQIILMVCILIICFDLALLSIADDNGK